MHTFECISGKYIPMSMVGDYVTDCPDGEDEILTQENLLLPPSLRKQEHSEPDQSQCELGGQCFQRHHICLYDRINMPCRNARHLPILCRDKLRVCSDSYKCVDAYCIPLHHVCDEVQDCPQGDDEQGCTEPENRVCLGLLKCRRTGNCVHPHRFNDGVRDCPVHGDDEMISQLKYCPQQCLCKQTAAICDAVSSLSLNKLPRGILILNVIGRLQKSNMTFKSFIDLRFLDVSQCNIKTLAPYQFDKQIQLLYLNLSHNLINTFGSNVFTGLYMLHSLDLSNNQIYIPEGLEISPLMQLYNLKYLYLRYNNITNLNSSFVNGLRNLRSLLLHGNDISYVHPEVFAQMPNLTLLEGNSPGICCLASHVLNCTPAWQFKEFTTCSGLLGILAIRSVVWICGLTALVLNAISFIWWWKQGDVKSTFKYQAMSMSASDGVMAFYTLTLTYFDMHYRGVYGFYETVWRSSISCRVLSIIATTSYQMSRFMLVLISIDRLIVMRRSPIYGGISKKTCIILISTGWALSAVIGSVSGFINQQSGVPYNHTTIYACLLFDLEKYFLAHILNSLCL